MNGEHADELATIKSALSAKQTFLFTVVMWVRKRAERPLLRA